MSPVIFKASLADEPEPIKFEQYWPRIEDIGPALWAELHTVDRPSAQWLANWLSRVPAYCGCPDHFREIMAANPVRFDDFFAWSVEAHNAVNEYLGKPTLSLEEAREFWKLKNHFQIDFQGELTSNAKK